VAPTVALARYAAMVQDNSGAKWCSALNYKQISIGWMRVGAIRRRFCADIRYSVFLLHIL
jgi:hypothetical protein